MICDKCGSMIQDRATTCPVCKSKVTPKVTPIIQKASKGGRRWIVLAVAVVALLVAAFFGWKWFSGGLGKDDPTPSGSGAVQSPSAAEYPLYWPDFMDSMESGTYTQELVTVKVTQRDEKNYGLTSYMGKICVASGHTDQIDEFIEMVQEECHFELVHQEDGKYYFRFTGSNAPVTMKSDDVEYHCFLHTTEEDQGVMVTYDWMTDFSTDSSSAKMEPVQTAVQSMPEETDPIQTDPVETDPPQTKPAENTPAASGAVLPDPAAFFGGGILPSEDEAAKADGWHLYYRMEIDAGEKAAHEYVELLSDPRFQLTMRPRAENDDSTILYLKESFYFFDYTGSASVTPMQDRFYRDGYEDVVADVFIWIQKNSQNNYTAISIYFSSDLEVTDLGDRASNADVLSPSGPVHSGTTGSSYEPESRVPCGVCNGSGDCQTCGGDGYLYSSASDKEDRNCYSCHTHRGKCGSCGGDGWLD